MSATGLLDRERGGRASLATAQPSSVLLLPFKSNDSKKDEIIISMKE
jgi:hypothetical protein